MSCHEQQPVSDTILCVSRQFHHTHSGTTGSQWCNLFSAMHSHCIVSLDQQAVSDTAIHFCIRLVSSMTIRLWVTLLFYCHAVSPHLIPWPIGREWQCTLYYAVSSHLILMNREWVCSTSSAGQPHHISSNTNRLWVTLPFFLHHISSHGPTGCEWCCDYHFFCQAVSPHVIPSPTASVWHHPFFCHITSHPITNRLWVTLLFVSLQAVSLISSHDQQHVSNTTPFHAMQSHPLSTREWVTPPIFSANY